MTDIFEYLMLSRERKVVAWVAPVTLDAERDIHKTFGGFLTKRCLDGTFQVGPHKIVVVTPRSTQRIRGFRVDAAYVDVSQEDYYTRIRQTLLWAFVGADEPPRFFNSGGEITEGFSA